MSNSLYIHIPFCTSKCTYCSFNSYAGLEGLQERYVEALCGEMALVASRDRTGPLRTVFLGGGTPSVLSPEFLRKLLGATFSHFTLECDGEISMEINPGTVDPVKLDCLRGGGVNRISFGVQSFDDRELGRIGRIHSAKEAITAITMAERAGFDNISLDLMYGLPGQTHMSWRANLTTAISLGVKHLSLYQLTVEEQTPLWQLVASGRMQLPDEDELAQMDAITAQLTTLAGLAQYEISNYAQTGYACRHNIGYWENDEYLGVGAGAVSYDQGIRRRNVADPVQYCILLETGKSVVVEEEVLDSASSFRETVIMGLRMNRGVSLARLMQRYGINLEEYYGTVLQQLLGKELLEIKGDSLCLTGRGRVFANLVMAELV